MNNNNLYHNNQLDVFPLNYNHEKWHSHGYYCKCHGKNDMFD